MKNKNAILVTIILFIIVNSTITLSQNGDDAIIKGIQDRIERGDKISAEEFAQVYSESARERYVLSFHFDATDPNQREAFREAILRQRTFTEQTARNTESYLAQITEFRSDDKAIANRFFSTYPNRIYATKDSFIRYTRSIGVVFTGVDADVKSFGKDGLLRGTNGAINVFKFKDRFMFAVDSEGNIVLMEKSFTIAEGSPKIHDFTGDIEYSNGKIKGKDITINGYSIVEGDNIVITEKGIEENALGLEGMQFTKRANFKVEDGTIQLRDVSVDKFPVILKHELTHGYQYFRKSIESGLTKDQ